MSFSSDIKDELCRVEWKRLEHLRAECYGAWLFSRCFSLREGAFVTENGAVARRMLELAAAGAGVSGELSYGVSRRKKTAYRVALPEESGRRLLLEAFGHTGREASLRINRGALEDESCLAPFLRGAFLACGTATDPRKEYHLEYAVPHKNLANDLYTLLCEAEGFPLAPAVSERKGAYVVYVKLMQVKMYKEAKNNINRKTNFETANMDKTYSASARQIAAIAAISDTAGLESLPENLRQLAQLRLDEPELTLRELGARLGISRSGVNHRLQRLLELGEKIMEEKGIHNLM